MQHVSSSATVFLKFALPTVWIVFFGSLCVVFWLFDTITVVAGMPLSTFRIVLPAFFILGVLALYWSVMRLKRVEMDEQFIQVTNYFKHYRYPYHQIEKNHGEGLFTFPQCTGHF